MCILVGSKPRTPPGHELELSRRTPVRTQCAADVVTWRCFVWAPLGIRSTCLLCFFLSRTSRSRNLVPETPPSTNSGIQNQSSNTRQSCHVDSKHLTCLPRTADFGEWGLPRTRVNLDSSWVFLFELRKLANSWSRRRALSNAPGLAPQLRLEHELRRQTRGGCDSQFQKW